MKFHMIRDCKRTEPEQRYIWAGMEIFPRLPAERREEIRALVERLSDTPEEGRALFSVLTRGVPPQVMSQRTGVPLGRLYAMRRAFFDQLPLR